MKKRWIFFIVLLLYCFTIGKAGAQNNKVGIHILETVEVEKAAQLVNSNGGDWGYATIVLRDDDLDKPKWQKFMDECRRQHVIPIVRLATHTENGLWAKPKEDDLDKWVQFLNSLNWPVKQQIVVLFNEPNHAAEWGGAINPQEYATLVYSLIHKFRESNSNFYVMLGGLDQAADGQNKTMREQDFLASMVAAVPDIFDQVDGWCSHSYPRSFVGKPELEGRASIKGYLWEINQISNYAKRPNNWEVYITETGWPSGRGYFIEEVASDYLLAALQIWEQDEQVKAVTPFVLNYPAAPFEDFSWLKADVALGQNYEKVLGVSKKAGEPEQIESFELLSLDLPEILPINYEIGGQVKIKNTGQWIMGELVASSKYQLLREDSGSCEITQEPGLDGLVEPGQEGSFDFRIKTSSQSGVCKLQLGDQEHTIYTFKPFELRNENVSLWQQIKTKIRLWWKDFKNK